MATGGTITVSAADEYVVADVHGRAINQIFGSGLTLASLVSYPGVDQHVAQRLCDVIDELDAAVRALRSDALDCAAADRDGAAPDVPHSARSVVARLDPTADLHPDRMVWRRIFRIEDAGAASNRSASLPGASGSGSQPSARVLNEDIA